MHSCFYTVTEAFNYHFDDKSAPMVLSGSSSLKLPEALSTTRWREHQNGNNNRRGDLPRRTIGTITFLIGRRLHLSVALEVPE